MDFFGLLTMIGGLALFLYGMNTMGNWLIRVSNRKLSEKENKTVSVLLHCIGDFERISDHAVNLMEAASELYEKGDSLGDKSELKQIKA